MNFSILYLRNCLIRLTLVGLAWTFTALEVQAAQSRKEQILTKARQAYYNLRRSGLIEFQSKIRPNWELLLTGVDTKSGATNLLNGLSFSVSIDSASKLQMDHHAGVAPPDQKTAESLDKIFRGMDQAVSSFFANWSIFMLRSPFPETGSDYEIKEAAGQYRFSQKEVTGDVLTITDQDFMITAQGESGYCLPGESGADGMVVYRLLG